MSSIPRHRRGQRTPKRFARNNHRVDRILSYSGFGIASSPLLHLLLLAGALALTGCLEYRQSLTLHPDGSGLFEVTYAVHANSAQALLQSPMVEGETGLDSRWFDENQVRRDFRDYEAIGVRLDQVDISRDEETERMHLRFRFERLQALLETPFFSQSTVSLRKQGEQRTVLTQTLSDPSTLFGPTIDLSDPQGDAALRERLRGVRVEIEVAVPGKILSTNADCVEQRIARWVIDLGKDPSALDRARRSRLRLEFDGSGASLPEVGPQQIRLPPPE